MKLQQLRALKAVAECGSFQAAARRLNKTHPSLITAIKNLEQEVGLTLFDRNQYRAALSEDGQIFYERSLRVLGEVTLLEEQARHMAAGEEAVLNIIVGDISPLADVLPLLRTFTQTYPQTQLNLMFENLGGPVEKLLNREADLIVHHSDRTDRRLECIKFALVDLIPVAAPLFLGALKGDSEDQTLGYDQLANRMQCIIRDTGTQQNSPSYHLLKTAPKMTVGDQHTKRQVLIEGLAWGHMPHFMVDEDIAAGHLVSLEGQIIKRHSMQIDLVRRADQQQGIMGQKLWDIFAAHDVG